MSLMSRENIGNTSVRALRLLTFVCVCVCVLCNMRVCISALLSRLSFIFPPVCYFFFFFFSPLHITRDYNVKMYLP